MKKRLMLVTLCLSLAFGSIMTGRIFAQDNGGSGLGVMPTRNEISINPGETETFQLYVRNVTSSPITAKVFINDFTADNETGEPQIILDDTKDNPASIRRFIGDLNDIDLSPGEEKVVDVTVDVPGDAVPGAYYGVIRYAAIPRSGTEPDSGQVSLTASVGSLVLIEVAGDIHEQLTLNKVLVYQGNQAGSWFVRQPDRLAVDLTNNGNGFAKPYGTLNLEGPFGKSSNSYEINDTNPRSNILPNSSRTFSQNIDNLSWPGRYRITASISYGDGGDVLIQSKNFWYLPVWFLVMLGLLVLAMAVAILKFRNRLPGYKASKSRRKK